MAKRQVFFSFHFDKDIWRVGQVRNISSSVLMTMNRKTLKNVVMKYLVAQTLWHS